MNPSAAAPVAKTVVLVGAGNAHLVFVRRWAMRPAPGVAVVLVNEAPAVPYSAMVPGHVAGDFPLDAITIDLVRLCAAAGVRLVAERVTRIDPATRRVHFAGRPPLAYDVLSLGVGSVPACPTCPAEAPASLVLRPLATLVAKLDALARLRESPGPFHLVVVGGGASGCELALAIHKRLGRHVEFRLSLLHGGPRLLPEFPAGVADLFGRAFRERGIACRVNARVTGARDGMLLVEGGPEVACDAVLWATDAAPLPLLRESGLAVDERGFLLVRDTLQSEAEPAVFGTGDCVSFPAYPNLPRNGVHAVREGRVLFDNVLRFLRDEPTRPFRPQRFCLCLLNTADGRAVFRYGPLVGKGRWARLLKDSIDRAWMDSFARLRPMMAAAGDADAVGMRCGGCGSKVPGDVLAAVLRRLDVPADPRVIVGCREGEDAAVHRMRPELFGADPAALVEVQTVDYFKAFVDDPYLFGRVAALHALSDLYAKNARPFSALAIATLPYARGPVQEGQLYELLSGAVESLRGAGVVLTGGHTTEGSELALGFAVTGYGEEGRLFRKAALRPGDALVLTKPLGSGALLAAWMRGECRAAWYGRLVAGLLLSNAAAADVFARSGVAACTDVTGFGLAGHLFEMLDASGASARLDGKEVPLYEGFAEVVGRGIVSTLHEDNARVGCRVGSAGPLPAWLFDPQTSGGLLAGVRPDASAGVVAELHRAGFPDAAVIGEVSTTEPGASATGRLTPSLTLRALT
jgi:selenide,water dikinase